MISIKFGDYNGGFTKVSMGMAVSATSKHPKEAAMLIDYLLNDPEASRDSFHRKRYPKFCKSSGNRQ